jgi:hypothetical protein
MQPERCDLYAVAEGAEAPTIDRRRCAARADGLAIMASASVGEGLPRLPEATALRRASACNDAVFQQREKHHDSKKPTHRAFVVKKFTDKAGKEQTRWLDIGSVWSHRDGKALRPCRPMAGSSFASTNPSPLPPPEAPGVTRKRGPFFAERARCGTFSRVDQSVAMARMSLINMNKWRGSVLDGMKPKCR